jgi:hypothetical protein
MTLILYEKADDTVQGRCREDQPWMRNGKPELCRNTNSLVLEQRKGVGGAGRTPAQVSLYRVAANIPQIFELGFFFHSLSDYLETKTVSKRNDCFHDRIVLRGARHVLDERTVDLQCIYGQTREITQG